MKVKQDSVYYPLSFSVSFDSFIFIVLNLVFFALDLHSIFSLHFKKSTKNHSFIDIKIVVNTAL